jgi:hypothetical protein
VAAISYAFNYSHKHYPTQTVKVQSQVMKVTGLFGTTVGFVEDAIAVLNGARSMSRRFNGGNGQQPAPTVIGGRQVPQFRQTAADVGAA